MCCVMPPNSFSATFDFRIASRSEVLPWSTWPMTVTTGGRSESWAGSISSSSTTSPSTERISTSTLNLSATSLAAVGSRSSLTVAITPSSSSALMTSPDLRRIFSASSPTVIDSGTRMSSRLTSTGGAVGSSTTTGATAAGATGTGAGAGTGGARGAAGTAGRLTIGAAGWGAGRGGGAGAAGRDGDVVTLGGANGPVGCRDGRGEGAGAPRSRGRNGTILGSGFFGAAGPGGGAIGATDGFGAIGSGGGATTVGSGTISGSGVGTNGGSGATSVAGPTGFGFTIVAAGLTSAGSSSSVFVFLDLEAGFFASASPTVAASAASSATLGFGTRLGFGASGRSRPFPSFTRSAFASVLSRGLMARMPLWPISSAATIKSLLVTPSSLASSITLILAAATVPSPPYILTVITSTSPIARPATSQSSATSGFPAVAGTASRRPAARTTAARSGWASLGFLNAWPSRPRLNARSTPTASGHTYAPRPAPPVPESATTVPFGSRTSRTSMACGRARRHPKHVRVGGVFTRASDLPAARRAG